MVFKTPTHHLFHSTRIAPFSVFSRQCAPCPQRRGDFVVEVVYVDFDQQIAPFKWLDHGDGTFSVSLYAEDSYKEELFKIREEDGFWGSGYCWDALAQVFLNEKCPELESCLEFDPETLMFCVYSRDENALRQFVALFKETCESDTEIADIFSRAIPLPPITPEDMKSFLDEIMGRSSEE